MLELTEVAESPYPGRIRTDRLATTKDYQVTINGVTYNLAKLMHWRLRIGPQMRHVIPNATYNNTICPLCLEEDSPMHLFLDCRHLRALWSELDHLIGSIIDAPEFGTDDSKRLFVITSPTPRNTTDRLAV